MTKNLELNKNIVNYLNKKYNILYHTNFLNFDENYEILYNDLVKIKKEKYSKKEKIIIEHFDTDYYDNSLTTGLHIRNTIECLRSADIPFFSIIFITCYYNLDRELEILINKKEESFPIILKTISSKFNLIENFQNINLNLDLIKKPAACCMAGSQRSHRNSIFNFIKNKNLFEKISVTYKNES
jgi:hypothetical protein